MPEVNIADGDVVTGADFDSIDDQLIITCTSSTRPSGVEGRHIFETDTNKRYVYDGSAWNLDGGSGWVSFTPSWTNLTVGNGSQFAEYRYVDGAMRVRIGFTLGTTSSITGDVSVAIPNSETSRSFGGLASLGTARLVDATTRDYVGMAYVAGSATSIGLRHTESGNYGIVNATNPFTWTTSDVIQIDVTIAL